MQSKCGLHNNYVKNMIPSAVHVLAQWILTKRNHRDDDDDEFLLLFRRETERQRNDRETRSGAEI